VKACFLGLVRVPAKHFAAASFTSTSLLQEELGVSQAAYLTAAVVSISALRWLGSWPGAHADDGSFVRCVWCTPLAKRSM